MAQSPRPLPEPVDNRINFRRDDGFQNVYPDYTDSRTRLPVQLRNVSTENRQTTSIRQDSQLPQLNGDVPTLRRTVVLPPSGSFSRHAIKPFVPEHMHSTRHPTLGKYVESLIESLQYQRMLGNETEVNVPNKMKSSENRLLPPRRLEGLENPFPLIAQDQLANLQRDSHDVGFSLASVIPSACEEQKDQSSHLQKNFHDEGLSVFSMVPSEYEEQKAKPFPNDFVNSAGLIQKFDGKISTDTTEFKNPVIGNQYSSRVGPEIVLVLETAKDIVKQYHEAWKHRDDTPRRRTAGGCRRGGHRYAGLYY